jgi:hypothetical protein
LAKLNTMKRILPFLFLITTLAYPSLAQKLTVNQGEKMSHAQHRYYIGNTKENTYMLASNYELTGARDTKMYYAIQFSAREKFSILKYGEKFVEPQQVEIDFKHTPSVVLGCYMPSDNQLCIIYKTNERKDKGYYADIFDLNCVYQSTITLPVKVNPELKGEASFAASPNGNFFALNIGKKVTVMDKDLKKVWEKGMTYEPVDFDLMNDGSLVGLIEQGGDENRTYSLFKFNDEHEFQLDKSKFIERPDLKIVDNTVYVVVLNPEPKSKGFFASSTPYFRSFKLIQYSLNDLSKIKEDKVTFNDEVLLKSNNAKKIEKVKGVPGLMFKDVYPGVGDKDPLVIFQLYELKIVSNTSTNSSGMTHTTSSSYYDVWGDIILVKVRDDANSQKIIPRTMEVLQTYGSMGSLFSVVTGDKLFMMFNISSHNRAKLQKYTFSNTLEELKHSELECNKEYDIDLEPRDATKLADNKYLFLGSNHGRKIGTAILQLQSNED